MPAETRVDVPTLLGLGLDEPLAEVWMAMAAAPGVGVPDIAEMVGISESQVREVLDDLADRALVRASRLSPGVLLPIEPEAVLVELLRRQQLEVAEQGRRFEEQRERITRIVAERVGAGSAGHRPRDPEDLIEHVAGAHDILARFHRIVRAATVSVEYLIPVTGVPSTVLTELWPLDADLLRRGVRIRSLYVDGIRTDPPMAAYARDLQTGGAQVRTHPTLPQRLFVSDRRVALVPLESAGRGLAVVHTPAVVASLLELFDAVWHNAAPLDVGDPVDASAGLSRTERTLLNLLADGASDETAARRLGISLRMVRRIMADLMHRLDASSRFEAGIKAAKRGWL